MVWDPSPVVPVATRESTMGRRWEGVSRRWEGAVCKSPNKMIRSEKETFAPSICQNELARVARRKILALFEFEKVIGARYRRCYSQTIAMI